MSFKSFRSRKARLLVAAAAGGVILAVPLAVVACGSSESSPPPNYLLVIGAGSSNMAGSLAEADLPDDWASRQTIKVNADTETSVLNLSDEWQTPVTIYGPFATSATAALAAGAPSTNEWVSNFLPYVYEASASKKWHLVAGVNVAAEGVGFTGRGTASLTPFDQTNFLPLGLFRNLANIEAKVPASRRDVRLIWSQGEVDTSQIGTEYYYNRWGAATANYLSAYYDLLGTWSAPTVLYNPNSVWAGGYTSGYTKGLDMAADLLPNAVRIDDTGLPQGDLPANNTDKTADRPGGRINYGLPELGPMAARAFEASETLATAKPADPIQPPSEGVLLINQTATGQERGNWVPELFLDAMQNTLDNASHKLTASFNEAVKYRQRRTDGTPYYRLQAKYYMPNDRSKFVRVLWEQRINPAFNVWQKNDAVSDYRLLEVEDTAGIGYSMTNAPFGPFRVDPAVNGFYGTIVDKSLDSYGPGYFGMLVYSGRPTYTNPANNVKFDRFGDHELRIMPVA